MKIAYKRKLNMIALLGSFRRGK